MTEWIPVAERLPEPDCKIIVFTKEEDVGEAWFDGEKFHWTDGWPHIAVTHWMDLPKPPREGEAL